MKLHFINVKLFAGTIIFSIIFLISGCDDSFNPNGDFRQKFVLNCILRGDTNYQAATVSRSFEADPFNPTGDLKDQSIKGARVRIWINDDVFELRDTTIERTDTSVYNFPAHYYYNDSIKVPFSADAHIEAILNEGKILTSDTKTPSKIKFSPESDRIIPPYSGDVLHFSWSPDDEAVNRLYSPRLYIDYYKKENGVNVHYLKNVPLDYIETDAGEKPYFALPGFSTQLSVPMSAFNKNMESVAPDDGGRSLYQIKKAVLEIVSYDENLTGYYSAAHFLDENSIRIDRIDYNNIDGGLGIFGSFAIFKMDIGIDAKYITEFGYRP